MPAAVIVLGLAGAAGGYVVAGGPGPIRELLGMETKASVPPTASVELQVECANIKHAYTVWHGRSMDIATLELLPSDMAGFKLESLGNEGKDFLDAVTGHKDQPSKRLATAIADYNYQVSLVRLENQLGGSFKAETYQTAIKSSDAVDVAYRSFAAETCP